ncbi:MAG TPA: hypothetical protein VFJ58_14070 [Armatimonadota bacterium]|nr:hypothetical protein [Armatimonadota bacterium]
METSHERLSIEMKPALYRALRSIARQERRSVPQMVQLLLEEGLRAHGSLTRGNTSPCEIAVLAEAGRSFDWLADEPEIYDDNVGELT